MTPLPLRFGLALLTCTAGAHAQVGSKTDGYRGVWYANQPSKDEYVYKYSGGLGTYCAKHQPFAVYVAAVKKTFFCYGGSPATDPRRLHHLVSYYDHERHRVPRPTVLLDKKTTDAHDNPVLSVDADGHVWIFSTSHGRSRPSFIHRSRKPYDVDAFERITPTFVGDDGEPRPLDNFSYFQAWHLGDRGFACFFTRYRDPAARTSMFMTSRDGTRWSRWQRLAAIDLGHYQISAANGTRVASASNYHPAGQGLNWRTNLYYMASDDLGATWRSAAGEPLELPLTEPANPALVHDYEKDGLRVYLKDLRLDAKGHPTILFLTSKGFAAGPANGPRTWRVARWRGKAWQIHSITTSDNNYDMGSLFGSPPDWRVIAPLQPGPQRFNPGGEIVAWRSGDDGKTWQKHAELTAGSRHNHTYVRRPVRAHPDFYALWADGHGRQPSASRLYFATRSGRVFALPQSMAGAHATPREVRPKRPR